MDQLTRISVQRRSRGMALVIVLASLVFLAALGVAFLTSSVTELKSSTAYAEGGRAQLFAQAAVNLVLAQINDGTRGVDSAGALLSWASQPGMIRTYDVNGNAGTCYKLYSWDAMTSTSGFNPASASEKIPSTWYQQPGVYTDLNEPIAGASGRIYPIVDGNNLSTVSGNKTYASSGTASISGFYVSGTSTPLSTATNANPVPMPVKWLYILADGTFLAPSSADSSVATFSGSLVPTAANPIVGRIAFWADDETCKININTASDGTFWDTPRIGPSVDNDLLINNQPVNGEYQRYPGHPAMTAISTVFKNLTKEQIYQIIPRLGTGGSTEGTVITTQSHSSTLNLNTDRLYASVDELMFKPSPSGSARPDNNSTVITADALSQGRFFLTAGSRSPDLNLFGKPRVNIWPVNVNDSSDYRTTLDSTIAFCSTLRNDLTGSSGPYRFYFQRENSTDPTHDLPSGPAVSGLGRNRMLLNYLKYLASQKIPGFGASFLQKYNATDVANILPSSTTELDQILTEIFDYIRCTNLADSNLAQANTFTPGVKHGTWYNGLGQVVPIEDTATGTRGFGRYRTVQGANFLFIGQVDGDVPSSQVDSTGTSLSTALRVATGSLRIQAVFIPQLFDVSVGSPFSMPNIKVTMSGLDAFTWSDGTTTSSMGYSGSITPTGVQNQYALDGAAYGDQLGWRQWMGSADRPLLISGTLDVPKSQGYFIFNGGDVTFRFYAPSSSTLIQTVVLRFPAARFPLPTLAEAAMPDVASNGTVNGYYNMRYFSYSGSGCSGGRLQTPRSSNPGGLIISYTNTTSGAVYSDVIRSVAASLGDMRLVAARKTVPPPSNSYYPYAANAQYGDLSTIKNSVSSSHTLWSGDGNPVGYSSYLGYKGKLVKDAAYDAYIAPCFQDVPLNGVSVAKKTDYASGDIPGDWDTGVAEIRDGPYINKPDEGDVGSKTTTPYKWKYHVGDTLPSSTLFTPNRLVASPVTFGSLPSGVLEDKPWQTLLFRPGPKGHPGLGLPTAGQPPYTTLPDHLLLDLFHMPVVEPYPISEPFSTAGRINMNYQIVPFTYINRDTGIRALLKSEKVISILTSRANNYKINYSSTSLPTVLMDVNVDETLTGFASRFAKNDLFRAASEICDIDIVPSDYTGTTPHTRDSMDAYWSTRLLTGDNCRERVYATLYPRLTTQSNTFTIHFRAQALKKSKGSPAHIWNESLDRISGEYRGFETVERYIDPNNSSIPDYADTSVTTPISRFYKFRVLQSKQFAP